MRASIVPNGTEKQIEYPANDHLSDLFPNGDGCGNCRYWQVHTHGTEWEESEPITYTIGDEEWQEPGWQRKFGTGKCFGIPPTRVRPGHFHTEQTQTRDDDWCSLWEKA